MSLSPAAARTLLHQRHVDCRGYRRDDGLWDIEARLTDTKTYDFTNSDHGGIIRAGEPLHEMVVRVTIDDDFLIHRVEAATLAGPFAPCADIAPAVAELAGLRIAKGFVAEVRKRFGGVRGCTHIVEMFGPIATTAYQTLYAARERRAAADPDRKRPSVIDQCHALSADGPVVARLWPQFSTAGETSHLPRKRR